MLVTLLLTLYTQTCSYPWTTPLPLPWSQTSALVPGHLRSAALPRLPSQWMADPHFQLLCHPNSILFHIYTKSKSPLLCVAHISSLDMANYQSRCHPLFA
jgi:hypothetical protein